jgi:hypothetical protein
VALVIAGDRPAFTGFEGQARLSAVERLDLGFLIDRQHRGMGPRVHVRPTISANLSAPPGSLERLKIWTRCGCRR